MNKEEHDAFINNIYQENKENIEARNRIDEETNKRCFEQFGFLAEKFFFDRMRNPISLGLWSCLIESEEYKVVKQDEVGEYFVSTVWMGLNHSWVPDVLLIFETMVFGKGNSTEIFYQDRYCSEEGAIAGHEKVVEMAKKGNFEEEEKSSLSSVVEQSTVNAEVGGSSPSGSE